MTITGPWLIQDCDGFRRLDQFAPGRGLAHGLACGHAGGVHQPMQQGVVETVRFRCHQRTTETNHRADTDVEPVSVPPAVAVGHDLFDRLATDRPHPDLH